MSKIAFFFLTILISAECIGENPFKGTNAIITSEFIYQKDEVSFPSCHASSFCFVLPVLQADKLSTVSPS